MSVQSEPHLTSTGLHGGSTACQLAMCSSIQEKLVVKDLSAAGTLTVAIPSSFATSLLAWSMLTFAEVRVGTSSCHVDCKPQDGELLWLTCPDRPAADPWAATTSATSGSLLNV